MPCDNALQGPETTCCGLLNTEKASEPNTTLAAVGKYCHELPCYARLGAATELR